MDLLDPSSYNHHNRPFPSAEGGGLSEHLLAADEDRDEERQRPGVGKNTDHNHHDDDDDVMMLPVDPTTSVEAGRAQPSRLRDAWAAALFVAQQGWIAYLAVRWGWPHLRTRIAANDGDFETVRYGTFVFGFMLVRVGVVALLTGTVILVLLTRWASYVVPISLIVTTVLYAGSALYCLVGPLHSAMGAVCAVVMAVGTAFYARRVWHRTALAAVHLQTALTAVRTNAGVLCVAVFMTVSMTLCWCIWMLAVWGVYTRRRELDDDDEVEEPHDVGVGVMSLLLLSLFWTVQVHRNVIHVTTAGVTGTWWFAPEDADAFWSRAVSDSWMRAVSTALGSVCLGSLLTAVVHVLYAVARTLRRRQTGQRERCGAAAGSLMLCVLECLLRCTERLLTYFNKWAFVYVGLYGYDYLTAGQKVVRLFQERGWTTIIQDDLIQRALQMVTLGLGLTMAVLSVAWATVHPSWVAAWDTTATATTSTNDDYNHDDDGLSQTSWIVTFGFSLLMGLAVGHLLTGVVSSAVDTVLVAWAEAPLELERHYPGLYAAQVAAWRQAYPREFGM